MDLFKLLWKTVGENYVNDAFYGTWCGIWDPID